MSSHLFTRCTCALSLVSRPTSSSLSLASRGVPSSSSPCATFSRSSSTSDGPPRVDLRKSPYRTSRVERRPAPTPEEIAAETERRERLAKERLLRQGGLTPAKVYALGRERERVYSSNLHSQRKTPQERERLIRAAQAVRAEAVLPRNGGGGGGGGGYRDERRADRGRGGRISAQASGQQQQMQPGRVNQGTWSQGPRRDEVKAVVRGGAPRNAPNGQRRRKQARRELKKVTLPSTIRLENLTNLLGVKLFRLQQAIERTGLGNSRPERLLTAEDASLLALEFDFDPTIDDEAAFDIYPAPIDESVLLPRPPVTGIFGHVDHGKTSLLDALRSTTVAAGEAGGITQHIGAFEVPVAAMIANLRAKQSGVKPSPPPTDGATITFLDTPGHAAFTAMRERGAGVTDVVVLVVAADDGVKPQTEEVINLLKSSADEDLSVVVALTKCDKPGIDTLKVKQQLMAAGVEIEDFGGEVPCVEVSSVTGKGLPELLETISALAEVRDLKAEREGRAEGRVLESRVEKGRGNVATVLVSRGRLSPGAGLVAGQTWAKVRTLTPASGGSIKFALPGQPVEVTGWKELPSAGDLVLEGANEAEVKRAVSNRLARIEREKLWADVERLNEQRALESAQEAVRRESEADAKARGLRGGAVLLAGERAVEGMSTCAAQGVKELVLMIKADGSGTVEAVVGSLQGIGNAEARVKIISSSVGDVQESDVEMARAVGATIIGFNVKAPNAVLKLAARPPNAVKIHTSPIIYRLVDQVRSATADLLPKDVETRVHGEAIVQMIFEIGIKGRKTPKKVAGCKVNNGVFQKARKARVVRNGEVVFTGAVDTLKQVKKDVTEIAKGTECGIALEEWEELEVDDVVQSIEEIEVPRSL